MGMDKRSEGSRGLIRTESHESKEIAAYYGEQYDHGDEPEIDFHGLWRIIKRYQSLILTILGVVVLVSFLFTLLMRPVYTASSQLELNTFGRNVVKFNQLESENLRQGRYIQTQLTFLRSRAIAKEVIERLDLTSSPEFNGELTQRGPRSLINAFIGLFSSDDAGGVSTRFAETIYLARLGISPVGNSDIIRVSVQAFDPELAATIANEHVKAYISLSSSRRFGSSSEAKKYIENELTVVKERLKAAEVELTEFARENDNVDIEDTDNIILARMSALNESYSEVQTQRIDAETKYLQAKDGDLLNQPEILSDPLIESLKQTRAELKAEYLELSKLYKPKYPLMVELSAKIEEVESNLTAQAESILAGMRATYLQAKDREERLNSALNSVKKELYELRDKAVEFNILKREWEADKSLYSELLKRSKEVEVASGIELNAGSLVERAIPPGGASSPNMKFNLLAASIIGLGAGLSLAFFLAFLDDRVNDVRSLEKVTQIPTLVVLPTIDGAAKKEKYESSDNNIMELRALHAPGDIFCESIDSLRTSLKYSHPSNDDGCMVLAVTSAVSGEGKSLISSNLAASYAKAGLKTILIEVDLRRPRLAQAFDAKDFSGLVHAFDTGEPIKIRKFDELENLNMIFAGAVSTNPVRDLSSDAMERLLSKCRQEYDVVVLDCPPVLGLADTAEIASLTDMMILVVGAHKVASKSVEHAVERLKMVGAPLIGTIFNRSDPDLSGYDHYAYGYYTQKAS